MIRFEKLSKSFPTPDGGRKVILHETSMVFPSRVSVGLLGPNGSGKSTLMEMIGGRMRADGGKIVTQGTISWPVGFGGGFHGDMTGAQNIRFLARTYGVDTDGLVRFVQDFAGLGAHMNLPVRTYSQGMRSRLTFGVSLGIPFDTYLVDEVMAVGDAAFRKISMQLFAERLKNSGAIVVSHSMPQLRRMCTAGAVLDQGVLSYFDDIEDAIRFHQGIMGTVGDSEDDEE